jgi:hypothetical protein
MFSCVALLRIMTIIALSSSPDDTTSATGRTAYATRGAPGRSVGVAWGGATVAITVISSTINNARYAVGLNQAFARMHIPLRLQRHGSVFTAKKNPQLTTESPVMAW